MEARLQLQQTATFEFSNIYRTIKAQKIIPNAHDEHVIVHYEIPLI